MAILQEPKHPPIECRPYDYTGECEHILPLRINLDKVQVTCLDIDCPERNGGKCQFQNIRNEI